MLDILLPESANLLFGPEFQDVAGLAVQRGAKGVKG